MTANLLQLKGSALNVKQTMLKLKESFLRRMFSTSLTKTVTTRTLGSHLTSLAHLKWMKGDNEEGGWLCSWIFLLIVLLGG